MEHIGNVLDVIKNLSIDNWIGILGIIVGAFLSIALFLLQQKLSDKQKIDHRLQLEREVGRKLYGIRSEQFSRKVQLYNTKLIGRGNFAANSRSLLWGYPYHAAELYGANFDGLEFIVGIEEWDGNKYYRVGVIDYARVLSIRTEGDGSFNGMIFYVKPKKIQLDKYSIAYKSFRYYSIKKDVLGDTKKPLHYVIQDNLKKAGLTLRYTFWLRWKMALENRK